MSKFIEEIFTDDWEVETPTGWKSFSGVGKTIEYDEWEIVTETGKHLLCADKHILLDEDWNEIFCENLQNNYHIQTKNGIEKIKSVRKTDKKSNMYDLLDVEDGNIFYSNEIVSHNSTTAISYLIHYIIFNDNANIALLANKAQTAKELLGRLQLAYENLPKWLQHGVKIWNKASLELDNGSKIVASSTSGSAIRGGSYNVIFLDEFAFIPNQIADEFFSSVYPTITSGKSTKVIMVSCVTKDTYLLTPKGYQKLEKFIDFTKSGAYQVPDYSVMGKDRFYTSDIIVNQGRVSTNIIKTSYGEIECSETHKLWAEKDGVQDYYKSNDLRIGDKVSVRFNTQVFGNNDDLNFTSSSGVYYEKITPEIAHSIGKIYLRDHTPDSELKEILTRLGFDISLTNDKVYLPNSVLSWSEKNIWALFCGCLNINNVFDMCVEPYHTFTTNSKELLKQLNLLATNINILTVIKDNDITIHSYRGAILPEDDDDLIWYDIEEITKSENEVFDVSLPDINGDKWAHSVLYNNFLGHQTPKGMNAFYKFWTDAIRGKNEYVPTEVHWSEVPGRDEKWKAQTIANTSKEQWEQEFESFLPDTLLTIEIDGKIVQTTIGELYNDLSNEGTT